MGARRGGETGDRHAAGQFQTKPVTSVDGNAHDVTKLVTGEGVEPAGVTKSVTFVDGNAQVVTKLVTGGGLEPAGVHQASDFGRRERSRCHQVGDRVPARVDVTSPSR